MSFEAAVDEAVIDAQLREQVKGAKVAASVLLRLREELLRAHAEFEEDDR
jgi:hypothetical protein